MSDQRRMAMKTTLAATLAGVAAAALIATCAATASAVGMASTTTPVQGPHQTNAGALWASQVSAPSGGVSTTRAETTETTPGRFWTNRAQRGTRAANVGHL